MQAILKEMFSRMKFKQVYLTYVASWGQNSVVCQNEKKRRELLLIIQIKKYQFFFGFVIPIFYVCE
ncbi:hypothetical protein DW785_07905 [Bacteroides xylanisolvens]|jgi:hypothetical protein|uniref:Uncharacterized protein n=2 Tax=Bacteroidaceae TaxID=815 RepID=A0A414HNH3_BACT4|nr:hypothetical protein BUN20_02120 [Bacteroides fragilis]RGJ06239.1 hypothetical protein DXD78_05025 [Bacteroides sp. D20]RGJ37468.1 hypothetical protein DXD65_02730 [Bacteroides sp. 4_1_36]RHD68274.1 hypothetical protein DW785_07905 [Bacteroides xylanisolvens]RHD83146.1 hypothetical protein DW783_04920 [Phocaeicola vulgatus]RHD88604.1 hypothetical protein DW780_10520 [Bacteroides thetaiotaomicron]RJU56412.1 hypothetical protein DW777_05115 [Bacteroides sp. AM30-16]